MLPENGRVMRNNSAGLARENRVGPAQIKQRVCEKRGSCARIMNGSFTEKKVGLAPEKQAGLAPENSVGVALEKMGGPCARKKGCVLFHRKMRRVLRPKTSGGL